MMANHLTIVLILLFISWAGAAAAPVKYALLIGIEDYGLSGLISLQGPGNDIRLIKRVLLDKFQFREKNIITLTNRNTTHTNLERAFARLSQLAKQGDFIYIHYCGHGSQVRDQDGDEYPGVFDQTWVPYGSRSSRMEGKDRYDITDDELHLWLIPILSKTEDLVLVSDSCYSGSIARGDVLAIRSVPMDTRDYSLLSGSYLVLQPQEDTWTGTKKGQQTQLSGEVYKKKDPDGGILIGAARDEGIALEASFDGEIHGLFSWYWGNALLHASPGDTWGKVFKRASRKVTMHFEGQHPQFHGDADKPIFGDNLKFTTSSEDFRQGVCVYPFILYIPVQMFFY
jgi:hypothetical protein